MLGIAVDVYHVWWDPDLQAEIAWAGKNGKLFGFHVCDSRANTRHLLTDRGLMGDGCINLRTIRGWVEDAGFGGTTRWKFFPSNIGRWISGNIFNSFGGRIWRMFDATRPVGAALRTAGANRSAMSVGIYW